MLTDKIVFFILALFFVVCVFFSTIIPSFQSPDEFDHIERAYLLSKGVIILDSQQHASGGKVDTGLQAYMAAYEVLPFRPDRKLSVAEVDAAKKIRWTGVSQFRAAPGTGFYFPISYLPQAIGLSVGEKLGLTIDSSYQLARYLTLVSIIVILFCSFNLYPVNPLVFAILFLPMSIFQLSSASLDGITIAMSVFSIAAFLRISSERENTKPWLFYVFTVVVSLLVMTKIHLLPLLLLVLGACFFTRKNRYFLLFIFSVVIVVLWSVIVAKTTVGFEQTTKVPIGNLVLYYSTHPMRFFYLLYVTIQQFAVSYRQSFLGVLGWLDTSFSIKQYHYFGAGIVLIGLLSFSFKQWKTDYLPRLLLVFCALCSMSLVFLSMLMIVNQHPANIINGVQGRYFLIPVVMLAYAISGNLKINEGVARKIALVFLAGFVIFTVTSTSKLLIARYYLPLQQPENCKQGH